MTPAKPTIYEQIADVADECAFWKVRKDSAPEQYAMACAILDTLEAHKRIIEAAGRPEPVALGVWSSRLNGYSLPLASSMGDAEEDARNERLAGAEVTRIDKLYSPDLLAYADRMAAGKETAERQLAELKEKYDKAVKDSERINWVEAHPRAAQIMVGGKVEDCIFYGVSTANLMPLRDALDQIITQSEKSNG